jgi:murein L,D-transpeptidase YcbB/YkuD
VRTRLGSVGVGIVGRRGLFGAVAAFALVAGGIGLATASARAETGPAPTPPTATPTAYDAAGTATPGATAADTDIKRRLDQRDPTAGGEPLNAQLLRRFYSANGYQLVWDGRQDAAKSLWGAVSRADQQGLDPAMFHAGPLANPSALSPADRDLLLSDAFLSYGDALARGAVPVEDRPSDQILTPGPVDVVAALQAAMTSPNPGTALEALAPNTPQYAALRRDYVAYEATAKAGGWRRVDAQSGAERFRQFQQRLAAEGYLPAGYATGKYDDTTIAAMRAFQERHGIEPDGKLGPATMAELDVAAYVRVQQLALGLERYRWLPRKLPPTRVVVNTASENLVFYRDDQQAFRTRVVVGETDKQTPEFQSTINSVLYNPPWNVPYSIAMKEIFPKLDEEPDYLERHNMVMRDNGSVTQLPGAGTALGRLKFEMEDRFDVYLHDTPLRNLFGRDNRRQSHGCVRVQNPRDLASLLLGIPVEDINKGIAGGETTRHMLRAPVAVFLVYQTAFAGDDGQAEFRRDAYHRDEGILRYLIPAEQLPVAGPDAAAQRRG